MTDDPRIVEIAKKTHDLWRETLTNEQDLKTLNEPFVMENTIRSIKTIIKAAEACGFAVVPIEPNKEMLRMAHMCFGISPVVKDRNDEMLWIHSFQKMIEAGRLK